MKYLNFFTTFFKKVSETVANTGIFNNFSFKFLFIKSINWLQNDTDLPHQQDELLAHGQAICYNVSKSFSGLTETGFGGVP